MKFAELVKLESSIGLHFRIVVGIGRQGVYQDVCRWYQDVCRRYRPTRCVSGCMSSISGRFLFCSQHVVCSQRTLSRRFLEMYIYTLRDHCNHHDKHNIMFWHMQIIQEVFCSYLLSVCIDSFTQYGKQTLIIIFVCVCV